MALLLVFCSSQSGEETQWRVGKRDVAGRPTGAGVREGDTGGQHGGPVWG